MFANQTKPRSRGGWMACQLSRSSGLVSISTSSDLVSPEQLQTLWEQVPSFCSGTQYGAWLSLGTKWLCAEHLNEYRCPSSPGRKFLCSWLLRIPVRTHWSDWNSLLGTLLTILFPDAAASVKSRAPNGSENGVSSGACRWLILDSKHLGQSWVSRQVWKRSLWYH